MTTSNQPSHDVKLHGVEFLELLYDCLNIFVNSLHRLKN